MTGDRPLRVVRTAMTYAAAAGLSGMRNDIWPMVHTERRALIADLERLDDSHWQAPSLCDGWTVHDLVAHMVDTNKSSRWRFLVAMARACFDFDRQNADGVARERTAAPQEMVEKLRAVATSTATPPVPLATRIVEEVVHGEDIRRPLGITRRYPQEAVVRSLRHQTRTSASFGGARELLTRVRISATDTDFVAGAGPEIRGPALALLLAISGRRVADDELDGPGVTALT